MIPTFEEPGGGLRHVLSPFTTGFYRGPSLAPLEAMLLSKATKLGLP